MKIKLTDSGNVNLKLAWQERSWLYGAMADFLDNSLCGQMIGITEQSVMKAMHYALINELALRNFHLQCAEQKKITLTRPEAIAVMWTLKDSDPNPVLLEIKSELHKILS